MSSGPEIDWLAAARAAMEIEAESIRRASARLDGELIRAVDYRPKVSVEEGVARFVAWYRAYYGA